MKKAAVTKAATSVQTAEETTVNEDWVEAETVLAGEEKRGRESVVAARAMAGKALDVEVKARVEVEMAVAAAGRVWVEVVRARAEAGRAQAVVVPMALVPMVVTMEAGVVEEANLTEAPAATALPAT